MSYIYNIIPTTNPLSKDQLYEGLLVCFNDVKSNPNNTGTLEKVKDYIDGKRVWSAVLDGVRHYFTVDGYDTSDPNNATRLYGVLSDGDIDPTIQSSKTRSSTAQGEANTVSLHSMKPKDYFACEVLNALIQKIDNPLSMSDGTIALLAAKSYKIAQAMAVEAYGSRENDEASYSIDDSVYVDKDNLQTNTDRILYNINESIKANTKSNKEDGVKISNIDKVKFDGTPTIAISGTPNVNVSNSPSVTISGTPNVNINNQPTVTVDNMPSEPIEIEGTVSVDNFPESE